MSNTSGARGKESGYLLELLQGASKAAFLKNATGWTLEIPTCEWGGITCVSGKVTGINLSGNDLDGTLPGDISKIGSLLSINLATNRFSGPIPTSWATLPHLTSLDLSENKLEGTIPVLASNSIEFYLLSHNKLTGGILDKFGGNSENTRIFDVSYNQLTGSIPSLEKKFPRLEELDLSNNIIDGT